MTTRTMDLGLHEHIVMSDNRDEGTVSISTHAAGQGSSTVNMTRDNWAALQLMVGMLFGPEKESESGELPEVAFGITTSKSRPDNVTFSVMAPELRQPMAWDVDREQWAEISKSVNTHFNRGGST